MTTRLGDMSEHLAGPPVGALQGVVVADFTRVLAGPYATMLLADMGADVVKVERPPAGDDTRSWGPPFSEDGQATYFQSVNRNKRSIALELDDPADLAVAHNLVAKADVLVHNHRHGGMEKWGLGYEQLAPDHPGLVYAAISGFGSGAGADLPGYDLLAQATGGLMSLTGPPGDPTKVGVAIVDVVTGLHAAVGILAALRWRDLTGQGQLVEVDLLTSLLSALVNHSSAFVSGGVIPTSTGNAHASIAPYEPLPTADGPIVVAVGNDRQFRRFTDAIGAPELADDPRFLTNPARVQHREELVAALSPCLQGHTADYWQRELTAVGVPCGTINDVGAAFGLAEELGLDPIAPIGNTRTTRNPIHLLATPASYRTASPSVGQDDQGVRAWLADGGSE